MPSISQEMLDSLEAVFQRVGAAEGTIWLLNEAQDALVAAWNTGPNAEKLVGFHSQSLSSGLISLACITGQAICENEIYRNSGQDPTVDRMLQVLTCSMIAVPLTVEGQVRGIISCVKLKQADFVLADPPPFSLDDLAQVQAEVEKMELEMEAVPA